MEAEKEAMEELNQSVMNSKVMGKTDVAISSNYFVYLVEVEVEVEGEGEER